MVGSVKVVWVCFFGNPQRSAISCCAMSARCVCLLRLASRGQTKWPQTNAIHSAPQWSVRSKLCVCVFLVTLKGAQSNAVPCRLGVCVYCAWHLVAKVNGLKQTRSTLRHNGRLGRNCVCVFLVTLDVRDLRQGHDLDYQIILLIRSHPYWVIMAHWDKQHARML